MTTTEALQHHYGYLFEPELLEEIKKVGVLKKVQQGQTLMQIGETMVKNADKWYLPLLLMHGTEDRLCGIKGSDELAKVLKGDITYKRWEGLFHETHNEPEKKEVIQFSVDWIKAHL